ncbi:MAG: BamA/TamA family outer membrane protein [Fimbriimonadaceae bacterium]
MKGFTVVFLALAACSAAFAQQVIKTITVRGNAIVSEIAVKAAMATQEGAVLQQTQLRTDETRILDLGYFKDVKILVRTLSENEVELVVEVAENPVIREVLVRGNTVVTTAELTAAVTQIQELGRIYNNRFGPRIRRAVEDLYGSKGYIVGIDRLEPDPESEGTLLISLVEPRLREIRLIGLVRTEEKVIRRIMKVRPGDVYNEDLIRRDLEELFATRWFDDILVRRPDTELPGVYDLELEFFETRTGQINGGVALDPQSRLVGFVSYSDSNFRGSGQSVGANLSQATVGGGLSAEFAWGNRFYDSRNTSISARLYSRVVYNFTDNGFGGSSGSLSGTRSDERRTGFDIALSRPFARVHRGRVGIRFENVRSLDLDSSSFGSFVQQDGDLLAFRLGVDRDTRHPTVESFQGELASIMVEPSYSNISRIGGSVSTFEAIKGPNYYVRTMLDYRKYWSRRMPVDTPITTARPVLAFRASYGVIVGDVPFFEQMFVGGLGSLRGYENQRFWGRQSLVGTIEYRHPIQSNFSVVVFTDYGGAWGGYPSIATFSQTNSPDFHLGYGLGVSFRTPVGPIRIDFAFNDQGGSRTHFAFGSSF